MERGSGALLIVDAQSAQKCTGHSARNLAAARQGLSIEQSDDASRNIERSVDMQRDVIDHSGIDAELAIVEKLDESNLEKRVVGRLQFDDGREAQP